MPHTFDTLAFSQALKEGGFTEPQAQALSSSMFQLIDSQLATKADLATFALEIDRKLEKLRTEIVQQVVQWIFGAVVLQSGVTAVLLRLLH